MEPKIVGAQPKPRALIQGFDEATTMRIAEIFPTSLELTDRIVGVRSEEWDLIVCKGGTERLFPDHQDVLLFDWKTFGRADWVSDSWSQEVTFSLPTYAREFFAGPDLHPDLAALVERVLLPMARGRQLNPVLCSDSSATFAGVSPIDPAEPWVMPFLCTTEPRILAGAIVRKGGQAHAWCLPKGIDDPVPWVRAAVRMWHERNPERYPHDPGWPSDSRWQTREEIRLIDEIAATESDRAEYVTESEKREEKLRAELREAQDAAERDVRLLLTADGDRLAAAVQRALERLGFRVENRDELVPEGEARLEDLRVTSPDDDPEWIALVEVKGTTGGASVNALLKLVGRFVKNFREIEGRYPSRIWFIVNQFIGRDPASRPPILQTNPTELADFEADDGMAMDTSTLFDIVRLVDEGAIDDAAARRDLMKSLGRGAVPSLPEPDDSG